jgi:PAS domain S-box-containing protein
VVSSDSPKQPGFVNDEMFRLLVDNVRDYAIFMLDAQGIVTSWNTGAQFIKGYTRNEIVGRHFSTFYTPDAIARHWPQHELAMALEQGRFEDEGWRVRKDGSTFWANVVITPVYDAGKHLRGFAKITRDLTVRRRVEELQRTERQMNEFLAMLAHELRNPLSPIQSALDVIDRKPDDRATCDWARAIIQRQTHHLSRLVDDLLDVSRITRGTITLQRQPVDLKATVAQVIDALVAITSDNHRTIDVRMPDRELAIDADPLRISQIFSNLIGNAIKYTPADGHISITASTSDGFVTINVIDDGIGMTPDLVPRVFDLFVQGNRGLDRRQGGLGIGLTIAKRLVDLQGGTLVASSPGPDLGSRFTLTFPLIAAGRASTASPASDETTVTSSRRVLIVDDNRDAAESLATLIGMLGHEATVVHDGEAALGAAVAQRPDIMLLDIGLPGMDGFDVARRLRELPEMNGMLLVACTGYGRELRNVKEAGFDRHLVKPVSAAQLEVLLNS